MLAYPKRSRSLAGLPRRRPCHAPRPIPRPLRTRSPHPAIGNIGWAASSRGHCRSRTARCRKFACRDVQRTLRAGDASGPARGVPARSSPGGRIVLHHLTGASRLPSGSLPLPGPAAVVEEVPVDTELLGWVTEAGFGDVRLLKFGSAPSFTVQGVELRETIVQAIKPPSEADAEVVVVYKGPFCQLVDDAGRVFRRGERTRISPPAGSRSLAGRSRNRFFVCARTGPVRRCDRLSSTW